MTRLSEHFTLRELVASESAAALGIDNTPPPQALVYLARTAQVLESVRAVLGGHPVTITSGFRSEALNRAVGGSRTSAHMDGRAADFVVPGFGSPDRVARRIVLAGIVCDQLIFERAGRREWVHLGLPRIGELPRGQAFSIINGRVIDGFPALRG